MLGKMKLEHEDEDEQVLWCPVTKEYWAIPHCMQPARPTFHPWKYGQTNMDAIFGPTQDSNGESDLMKSRERHTLVHGGGRTLLEKTIPAWETSPIRELPNPHFGPRAQSIVEVHSDKYQKEMARLGGARSLSFRSDWRPRARYIYFAYCCAMLAESFVGKHMKVARNELGTRYWGTRGRYMRESMLLGFVEKLGHKYEYLLEGAIAEDGAEADLTGVAVANAAIKEALKKHNDNEEEEDESDKSEGEDDDDDGSDM
ncbi:MAG: hypothetical protein Q9195_003312 [Heterodermia aff. obscurata]